MVAYLLWEQGDFGSNPRHPTCLGEFHEYVSTSSTATWVSPPI